MNILDLIGDIIDISVSIFLTVLDAFLSIFGI